MFKTARSKIAAGIAGATAGALALPAAAQDAGVDVTGVVSAIEGASAPIAAIGGAVLVVMVGIKVYKWVRRAM